MKIIRVKNKLNRILNNEDGVTLVLVVCIFVFVSILSLGIISVATNESLQSINKNGLIQAEYASISGIEIMTDYITNHQSAFETKYAEGGNFPLNISLDSGTSNVDIDIENVVDDIRIKSTGNYGDNSSYKTAIIKKVITTPDYIFPIDFIDTDDLTGYVDLVIPTPDENRGDLNINSGVVEENLDTDIIKFNDINVDAGAELKFKTNVEKRTVIVDNITINGFFSFSDGGKVFLIVNNGATFNSEFLNANENLIILLKDTATININIPVNGKFYSYIYSKNGDVNINGSGELYGAIIAKNFNNNLSDSDNFIFLHPADVLSLKQYIKYNETYEYEFGYYEN